MLGQNLALDLGNAVRMVDPARIIGIGETVAAIAQRDGVVFVCGNGGSSATATMLASMLVSLTFDGGRTGIRSMGLSCNMALLTGTAQAYGYGSIFSAPLWTMGRRGDLLIMFSGSGNSPNIIEAALAARQSGMATVGFTGMGGGKLAGIVDHAVVVESRNMEQIENIHSIIVHALVRWLAEESSLAGANKIYPDLPA